MPVIRNNPYEIHDPDRAAGAEGAQADALEFPPVSVLSCAGARMRAADSGIPMPADPNAALPRFETARLWLRPRVLADLDACVAMDRDPEVTRYIAGPWHDPVEHRRFVAHRIKRDYPPGLGYWSIFEKGAPGTFVGWVLLIPDFAGGARDVEIGWRLVRAAWGRGIASEAAAVLVRHAFDTVRLPRLVADIAAANANSLNVARKLGMRRVGVVQDRVPYVRHRLERADLSA
ncbi:[ribosomal protein S5]-alanine N-acetyltransferase [Burkholderia multivorans]